MLIAINPRLSLLALYFPHFLSTNHKCTHPCLIAAQKRTLKWRTTTTSRSSRRAFTSQLPVGLDEALLKISFRISVERLFIGV